MNDFIADESDTAFSGHEIRSIETFILDIPGIRDHVHAAAKVRTSSYLLIRMRDGDGQTGYGEVATAGGPWWSGDSVEATKATIDAHLAPRLIGMDAARLNAISTVMDRAAFSNGFAKAGLEMALLDLRARQLGLPVHALLGGEQAIAFDLTWPLGSANVALDIEEAERRLAEGITCFKVKMGARPEAEDVDRAISISTTLADRAELRIDLNCAWTEIQAERHFATLLDAGYRLVEQPLPRTELAAHARLRQRFPMTLMADESLSDIRSLLDIDHVGAFGTLSLKPMKSGGLTRTQRIAELAATLGIRSFGGCFLETSLGTAACLQLGAALGKLELGCEWVGPRLLASDIVVEPLRYKDGQVHLPSGPGLGVEIDISAVERFTRS